MKTYCAECFSDLSPFVNPEKDIRIIEGYIHDSLEDGVCSLSGDMLTTHEVLHEKPNGVFLVELREENGVGVEVTNMFVASTLQKAASYCLSTDPTEDESYWWWAICREKVDVDPINYNGFLVFIDRHGNLMRDVQPSREYYIEKENMGWGNIL